MFSNDLSNEQQVIQSAAGGVVVIYLFFFKCERAQLSTVFCYVFSTEVQTNTSSCCYLLLSVTSKQSCSDLQKETEETRTSLEEALKTLKEQHKDELVQLEDRCGIHCDVRVSHARDNFRFSVALFIWTVVWSE